MKTACGCVSELRLTRVQVDARKIEIEMEMLEHHVACPTVPSTFADLENRIDVWGRDLRVLCDPVTQRVTVTSAGQDGRFGTDDDVASR